MAIVLEWMGDAGHAKGILRDMNGRSHGKD